ncbi:MAG: hypothetical protein JKX81_18965 [Arenicella sp.]|nr:hypothetical protein [Arenicella sp.]
MDKPKIIQVLEDAKLAHKAGDFVNSLKFYEYFFDHSLDDDPYAFYGARLSHCLNGWGELAQEFPGAKNRLEAKKREVLDHYLEQREPERFHDYLTICRVLGVESDAVEQFLTLHLSEPKSAAKLSKYLWNDLINAEQWDVCSSLMQQAAQKMDELFAVFDEAARLKEFDPSFDNIRFDQHIVDTLLDDLQKVVLVLRYANRSDDIDSLQRQFHQGVESRDHSILTTQVHAKSSFLFAGH